jgi:hypothetical protein
MEAKRKALAKAKPLFRDNGKTARWRTKPDLIEWLQTL